MSKIVCTPRLVKIITGNFARAITLYPFILLRHPQDHGNIVLLNHERIHIRQQREMLIFPFYLCYLLEYITGRLRGRNHLQAYFNISFEREAFQNEKNLTYLQSRPSYAFRKYFFSSCNQS